MLQGGWTGSEVALRITDADAPPTGFPVGGARSGEWRLNRRRWAAARTPRPTVRGRFARTGSLRPDVVVAVEDVRRVNAALDCGEPLVRRGRVGLADPRLALVGEEVRVDARGAARQLRVVRVRPGRGVRRVTGDVIDDRGH